MFQHLINKDFTGDEPTDLSSGNLSLLGSSPKKSKHDFMFNLLIKGNKKEKELS